MAAKTQYSVRCSQMLIDRFKARAESTGYTHPEVCRMLLREFAYGRISMGISATSAPPDAPTPAPAPSDILGDMLK